MRTAVADAADLERRTLEIGRALLAEMRAHPQPKFWKETLIAGAMADERFKTELFRFVDVFPVLKTPSAVHQHLVEYLRQPGVILPTGMGVALAAGGLFKGALSRTVAGQIEGMARTFIAGADLEEALPRMEARWREGIGFSVDLLGEACVSQVEADAFVARYMQLIEKLPALTAAWPANHVLERDHLPGNAGIVPRVNVSIKISALGGHISPVDHAGTLDRLTGALTPVLQAAGRAGVLINFDMEHSALKELTIDLFKRCCEQFDFHAGLALQSYLQSAQEDAQDLSGWARALGRVVTVRLIKGAYWDYETIHAEMMGWPCPVWGNKAQTDACYERVARLLIGQTPREAGHGGIKLALGTHNVRSVAAALAAAETAELPAAALEFQALRGMAEELKQALTRGQAGFGPLRVREYMPIGEMIPGMAYLVRRLLENTSNQGWLRMGQAEGVSDERLLASPHAAAGVSTAARADDTQACETRMQGFANLPPRDFSRGEFREAFAAAMKKARVAPVAIDATEVDAQAAVTRAQKAFVAWRDVPAQERAAMIRHAGDEMARRRDELAAEMVLESQKNWTQADGDVCEAVDFCRYYALHAPALFAPVAQGHFMGEQNYLVHEPRGVAAVIAPWNFPLAIPTGMVTAALVTGNTVVFKPAEQTPAIARRMCEALWHAGVPRDVLQFLPGAGETVGRALVRDPRVAMIAFTGSAAVGLEILKTAHAREVLAAGAMNGEHFALPRVIAEMGGKNAIIVDESADLDEAVLGVRDSAFGYAGQKCSACSRVIVLESVHDAFVRRLAESTRGLVVGDPREPVTDIGPVIDDAAAEKIWRYIAIGKQEARCLYPGMRVEPENRGRLIEPHIFVDTLPTHRIAQEEIFGPVLAVMKAKDFAEALAMANALPYKLTGGVFSRTPLHLAEARRAFRVGNLYLNRGITGALVGRQPFGGFGLSGLGTKAGGADYLRHFTDPRIITENTMRRGFAPGN